MDFKKLAFRSSLITGAIVLIGGSAILTYDQKPFYQEDLDDTRRMANGIERYIYGQYEYFDAVAKQESKPEIVSKTQNQEKPKDTKQKQDSEIKATTKAKVYYKGDTVDYYEPLVFE